MSEAYFSAVISACTIKRYTIMWINHTNAMSSNNRHSQIRRQTDVKAVFKLEFQISKLRNHVEDVRHDQIANEIIFIIFITDYRYFLLIVLLWSNLKFESFSENIGGFLQALHGNGNCVP